VDGEQRVVEDGYARDSNLSLIINHYPLLTNKRGGVQTMGLSIRLKKLYC
jgi:hypothetical protein